MPIHSRWKPLTRAYVLEESNVGGVYELGNHSGTVVYIGSSSIIRNRLLSHVNSTDLCIRMHASQYRVEYTEDYLRRERELYDEHVRLYGHPPRCNDALPPGR